MFVGRGAQFLLSRDQGLSVRVIADDKYRVRRMMEREGLNESGAKALIDRLERGRRDFVRYFSRRDISDPHVYDLIVRVDRLGPEAAAALIADAFERLPEPTEPALAGMKPK